MHPLLESESERFFDLVAGAGIESSPAVASMMPHAIDRVLGLHDPRPIAALVKRLEGKAQSDPAALAKCLQVSGAQVRNARSHGRRNWPQLRPQLEAIDSADDGLVARPIRWPPTPPCWPPPGTIRRPWRSGPRAGCLDRCVPSRGGAGFRRADCRRRPADRGLGRPTAGVRSAGACRVTICDDRIAGPRRCRPGWPRWC